MRDEISHQLRLGRKHAVNWHRGDRFSGGLDAKVLGQDAADPPRGRGRDHVMRRPTLRDGARNSPSARGRPSSVPTLIAPADSPKIVTLPGSPPKAAIFACTHSRAAS